jgi:1-acyl-sn-glycerol-3-phosphate acyltransferase
MNLKIDKKEVKSKNIKQENNKNLIEYKKIDNSLDKDIVVNYSCFCSKCFFSSEKILYILPCCHMVHENCFNDYIIKSQYKKFDINSKDNDKIFLNCPFCNNKIKTVLTEYKINSKKKYNQYRIDIKSVRLDNSAHINYMILPLSIVKFTSLMNKLIIANSEKDLLSFAEHAFNSLNIKINIIDNTQKNPIFIKNNHIYWKNKEDSEKKMVIISNHCHYFDSFIMYYLFRCGFVSSDFINHTDIGRIISTKLKLLIFKRGVDTNMVEKIKKYLDEQKKIVIYPEGTFANNETLLRFRTGAFNVGERVCPVVIKYDKVIYDDDFKQMVFKLITQNEINVSIYVNDFFDPPFDEEKIEKIRDFMCSIGKFEKSRVSNKSLKE